ncbi:MAG: extracellular solute-binding protein [Chloroflexi bacterium]|nr:extracellular solute-binding protein [Chloroflexota bacterium]
MALLMAIALPSTNSHAQSVDPIGQTIIFWHPHTGERERALNELVAQFNVENEWKITVEPRSWQTPGLLYDQIILQLTTPPENRSLPNIFVTAPYETATFALGGPILDLTPFIQDVEWGFEDEADFVPGISELGHDPFTNTQLGWPERLFAETLYVNMTALKEIGFDSVPTSLTELGEIACDYFAQTDAPAFQLETRAPVWAGLATTNGNLIFDGTAYTLNTEGMRKSLEMMNHLLAEGCVVRQTTPFAAQDEFTAGHSLFYFGTTSALPIIRDAIRQSENPFEWQVTPLSNKPYISGPTLSIFSHSPEADLAAWLFLRWWVSPGINAAWNRATGSLSIRLSAGELMAEDFYPQWRAVWGMVNQGGYFEPSVAAQDVVRLEIEFAIGRILDDPTTLEQELSALNDLANEILNEYAPIKQASP